MQNILIHRNKVLSLSLPKVGSSVHGRKSLTPIHLLLISNCTGPHHEHLGQSGGELVNGLPFV